YGKTAPPCIRPPAQGFDNRKASVCYIPVTTIFPVDSSEAASLSAEERLGEQVVVGSPEHEGRAGSKVVDEHQGGTDRERIDLVEVAAGLRENFRERLAVGRR